MRYVTRSRRSTRCAILLMTAPTSFASPSVGCSSHRTRRTRCRATCCSRSMYAIPIRRLSPGLAPASNRRCVQLHDLLRGEDHADAARRSVRVSPRRGGLHRAVSAGTRGFHTGACRRARVTMPTTWPAYRPTGMIFVPVRERHQPHTKLKTRSPKISPPEHGCSRRRCST